MAWVALAGFLVVACGKAAGPAAGRSRLVVYSPHGPEILKEMEQRFEASEPGIDMEGRYISQTDIIAKLRAEKSLKAQGESRLCDVWWGGTTEFFDQAAAEGLLLPCKPTWAGAVGPDFSDPHDLWHGQFFQVPCVMWNERAISAEEAPKDWDDLLDPRWKGRIVIRDPMASGTMKTIFSAMIQRQIDAGKTEEDGFAWLRALEGQTASYLPNPEAMFEKVGRSSEGYITLWNVTDALFQRNRNQYPFAFAIPAGPAPVSVDALAIAASSPHPEAARKFYEFCSNVENSRWLAEKHFRLNARQDLPPETIPEWRQKLTFTPMAIRWSEFNRKVGPWMERWKKEVRDPKK